MTVLRFLYFPAKLIAQVLEPVLPSSMQKFVTLVSLLGGVIVTGFVVVALLFIVVRLCIPGSKGTVE